MFCYLWPGWPLLLPPSPSSHDDLLSFLRVLIMEPLVNARGLWWDDSIAVASTQLVSALRLCKALTRQVFPSPHASEKLSSKEFWEACDERCFRVRWSCAGTPLFSRGLPRTWLLLCARVGLVTDLFGLQTEELWIGSDLIAFLPETAISS